MKTKHFIIILSSFAVSLSANAQQDPQFTQFMADKLSINPGSAGAKGSYCATLIGRQQWAGFDGAPKTILLNLQGPIGQTKSGVGLTFYSDKLGQLSETILRASYAYHLKLGGTNRLGIGASIGMVASKLGANWIATDDYLIDDAIPNTPTSNSTFDASFGAYFYNKDLYVGVSSTHLSEGELKDLNVKLARHYYLMAGYDYAVSSSINLQPNILVKSDVAATQFDVNLNVMFKNSLWVGATYRATDAIAPQLGYQYQLPNGKSTLRLAYSYDVTTSELNNYSNGSHEIMLNYCFKFEKPLSKQVYKNVRFL
jgi:type IX secretion system PorP/SprF family membrane protein